MTGKTMNILFKFFSFLLLPVFIIITGALPAAAASGFQLPSPDKINYLPLRFNLPQTQRVVLENGIVLYILEDHELPLVNIRALIKTGTIYDPEGKEGVAELTAYVMRTGGTAKLKSAEIDGQFDFMAASASISMSMEAAQVNFSILNKDLDPGLDLLAQIIIHPAFEQEKFELARQLTDEGLRRLKDDPQKLAFREFNRLIYHDDPRGRLSSHKSLANIERNDLIQFHSRFFQPGNIMFAVSGDITKAATGRPKIFPQVLIRLLKNQMPVFIFWTKKYLNPRLSAAGLPPEKMILIFMLLPFLTSFWAAAASLPVLSAWYAIMRVWLTAPEVFTALNRHTAFLEPTPLQKHHQP